MAHVKRFMECSICLDKFKDPKMLGCGHTYCEGCLEEIMVFNDDGSATLPCPLKCDGENTIAVEGTVKDLITPYSIIGILEASETEEEPERPSCYVENCKGKISLYCCDVLMCEGCSRNHQKINAKHEKKKVSFNKKDDKLKVICEKHVSPCTDLCCDDIFLCKYCLHRDKDHKMHRKNPIDRDVELLKEGLRNDLKAKEPIYRFKKATEDSMVLTLNKMNELLEERREHCLERYNDLLKREEEMLKRKFKSICDSHMKQYPQTCPEYYENMLSKKDVELAIQKRKVLETICNYKNKTYLNCVTVSLSECFNFKSEHPLGDIQLSTDKNINVNSSPASTLRDSMMTRSTTDININPTKADKAEFMFGDVPGNTSTACSLTSYEDFEELSLKQLSFLETTEMTPPTHHNLSKSSQQLVIDSSLPAVMTPPTHSSREQVVGDLLPEEVFPAIGPSREQVICDSLLAEMFPSVQSSQDQVVGNLFPEEMSPPMGSSREQTVGDYSPAAGIFYPTQEQVVDDSSYATEMSPPTPLSQQEVGGSPSCTANMFSFRTEAMSSSTQSSQKELVDCSVRAAERSSSTQSSQVQVIGVSLPAGEFPQTHNSELTVIIKNPSHKIKQVYFDVAINGSHKRMIFDLYDNIVPKTCHNFVQLCTHEKGFGYQGSIFYHVMRGQYCKGGDVVNNNGSAGNSVHGPNFQCENFEIKHDVRGILAMAKNGEGGNDSRFIIYTKPMSERNGDIIAFGKVTDETYPIIEEIVSVKCKNVRVGNIMYKKPCKDVVVANCGVL